MSFEIKSEFEVSVGSIVLMEMTRVCSLVLTAELRIATAAICRRGTRRSPISRRRSDAERGALDAPAFERQAAARSVLTAICERALYAAISPTNSRQAEALDHVSTTE